MQCSNSGFDVLACQLFLQFTETDHAAVNLIPKPELNGFQTAKEAQFRCVLEKRMRVVTALEVVVWNLGVEVVNVMVADVSGEPLEDSREVVVTASCHGGSRVVPIFVGGPVRIFELMLDVEQPEAKQGSD